MLSNEEVIQQKFQRIVALKIERVAVWSGPIGALVFFVGFWPIGHLMPVISPSASAAQIAEFWGHHTGQIQAGLFVCLLANVLWAPFFSLMPIRVARSEGRWGVLALMQALACISVWTGFMLTEFWAITASFRPQRAPEITQTIVDLFYLPFVGGGEFTMVQVIPLGIVAFIDQSKPRTFPRWYGYYCGWYLLLILPSLTLFFFKSGPLSYNGLIAFWLPAGLFGIWLMTTVYVLIKAMKTEEADIIESLTPAVELAVESDVH